MTATDAIDRILKGVTIPDTGLVLRATWDDPTALLSEDRRTELVSLTGGAPNAHTCGSTDRNGHWADIVEVSSQYWVARHVDHTALTEEYVIFATYADAYSHYEQVVRGQQDATAGAAWRECDVPGVLAGEHWALAQRVGYHYEEAARQYTEDRAAAVAAWSTLDVLST